MGVNKLTGNEFHPAEVGNPPTHKRQLTKLQISIRSKSQFALSGIRSKRPQRIKSHHLWHPIAKKLRKPACVTLHWDRPSAHQRLPSRGNLFLPPPRLPPEGNLAPQGTVYVNILEPTFDNHRT